MRNEITISLAAVFALGASAWLFDASPLAFALGTAAIISSAWMRVFTRTDSASYAVLTIDPNQPDAAAIRNAFDDLLNKVVKSHSCVILRLQTPTSRSYVRYELSLRRNAEPSLALIGKYPITLQSAGKWIADHPVPLRFDGKKACELRFSPAAGERVRVDLCRSRSLPALLYFILLGLLLSAGFFNLPELQYASAACLLFTILAPELP